MNKHWLFVNHTGNLDQPNEFVNTQQNIDPRLGDAIKQAYKQTNKQHIKSTSSLSYGTNIQLNY